MVNLKKTLPTSQQASLFLQGRFEDSFWRRCDQLLSGTKNSVTEKRELFLVSGCNVTLPARHFMWLRLETLTSLWQHFIILAEIERRPNCTLAQLLCLQHA